VWYHYLSCGNQKTTDDILIKHLNESRFGTFEKWTKYCWLSKCCLKSNILFWWHWAPIFWISFISIYFALKSTFYSYFIPWKSWWIIILHYGYLYTWVYWIYLISIFQNFSQCLLSKTFVQLHFTLDCDQNWPLKNWNWLFALHKATGTLVFTFVWNHNLLGFRSLEHAFASEGLLLGISHWINAVPNVLELINNSFLFTLMSTSRINFVSRKGNE
jgi:hypothetical protein